MRNILSLLFVLTLLALPRGNAIAQVSSQPPRIGVLVSGTFGEDSRGYDTAFLGGMRELGYVQGRNIIVMPRQAKGRYNLLPDLAAELVRLKVAAIVVSGPIAIAPTMRATQTIPIVMVEGVNAVEREFVESLARPGGNVTGFSSFDGEKMRGKQIEILMETIRSVTRVAVLNPQDTKPQGLEIAAQALRVELAWVDFNRRDHLESAFAKITAMRPDALITLQQAVLIGARRQIADFALKRRLPSMFESRDFAEAGGLLSYGPNIVASWRRAAAFVDKILKGANPANLPVEAAPFELVVNLATAKKLGIIMAPELLLEADEVMK